MKSEKSKRQNKICKQHKPRNRIIIITGAAVVGKSTLAYELSKSMGIRQIINTDIIKAVKIKQCPKNRWLCTDSYRVWRNMGKADTKKNIISSFKKYSSSISKEVIGVIEYNNDLGRDLIIEGVHLYPPLIKKILKWENVSCFVIYTDRKTHKNLIKKRILDFDDPFENRYVDNLKAINVINEHFREVGEKYGLNIICNKNDIKSAVKQIKKRLV